MKKITPIIQTLICYLFIVLFVYAAVSKLIDFETFQTQLGQSPILTAYATWIGYAVISVELIITVLLCFRSTRQIALHASFLMMIAFTAYIYIILHFSDFIPCSCGGILEKLSWEQHIVFNLIFALLACIAIIIQTSYSKFKISILLFTEIFIGIGLLCFLHISSEKTMKINNPFIRKFQPHAIDHQTNITLPSNGFYFAGAQGDTIFLGVTTAPLLLGTIFPENDILQIDTIQLDQMDLPFQNARIQVNYPDYSLVDGYVPAIFEGKLPSKKAYRQFENQAYFSRIVKTSSSNYIFRGQSTQTGENILGLQNTTTHHISFNTKILEKQMDGVFDTDGTFAYDPIIKNVIYTYFYRNEYRIIDSILQDKGRGNTIDTISTAQLSTIHLKDGTTKLDAPPLKLNNRQIAYGGFLFNDSNSQAKLDPRDIRKNNRIIDVYDYRANRYLYSFTVPEEGKEKIREMWLTSKYFYVLQDNLLIKYKRMHTPFIDE